MLTNTILLACFAVAKACTVTQMPCQHHLCKRSPTFLLTHGPALHAPAALQIIYSLTPVWAALLAGLLLPQEEATGPLGWCGGGVIIAATLVLSLRDDRR